MKRPDRDDVLPIGCTWLYPISDQTFQRFASVDQTLADRLIPPLTWDVNLSRTGHKLYLFSVGIMQQFRKSPVSSNLVKQLAADFESLEPSGMVALTISPNGLAICKRFKLEPIGQIHFGSLPENILLGVFSQQQHNNK